MKKTAVAVAAFAAVGIGAYVWRTVSSFIADYEARSRAMERARTGEPTQSSTGQPKRSRADQLIG